MKCLIVILAVVQSAFCGNIGAYTGGIQYVSGHAAYSTGQPLHGTPVATSGLTTSTFYGNAQVLRNFHHIQGHAVPQVHSVVPQVHSVVPQVHSVVPQVHSVVPQVHSIQGALVPTVHQVPAVADVPVTHIHAHQGFIQKEVDVAKPAVQTRRFELRRPAIQKEFYDIEERVIVRPAGSALVELDHPHSKVQKSSFVSPVAPAHPIHFAPPAHFAHPVHFAPPPHFNPAIISASPAPPTFVSPAPPNFIPQQPEYAPSPVDQGVSSDEDSVVVEARRRPEEPQPMQRSQEHEQQPLQRTASPQPQETQQPIQRNFQQQPQHLVRSRIEGDQSINQQRLIDLLTARQGVAEVGFGEPSLRNIGDAGQVRARVISAQYASKDAPLTGERVNTRRVVVSRPIETIEEVDVVEPVTKLERVAVQHPAVFKSAHVGYERVATSVPVLGKSYAPVVHKNIAAPVLASQYYYH